MICPKCQGELFEVVKHGVVIDHCSGCKGIWLDQGELAKIIAQMRQLESSLEAEFRPPPPRRESEDRRYAKHYDKHSDTHHSKKKSGFEKLFDIFD